MNVVKVLFVCMGNICRSPAAEGIFKKLVEDAKLDSEISIDSAGTIDSHCWRITRCTNEKTCVSSRIQFRKSCQTV